MTVTRSVKSWTIASAGTGCGVPPRRKSCRPFACTSITWSCAAFAGVLPVGGVAPPGITSTTEPRFADRACGPHAERGSAGGKTKPTFFVRDTSVRTKTLPNEPGHRARQVAVPPPAIVIGRDATPQSGSSSGPSGAKTRET